MCSLEVRVAGDFARLWRDQDKTAEAHVLGPAYGWFTEGIHTAEEAKALFAELM